MSWVRFGRAMLAGIYVIWSSNGIRVKNEDLPVDFCLLKKLDSGWILRLLLSGHEHRLFHRNDAPFLIAKATSSDCFSLTQRVAQDPAIDKPAGILVSLWVRLLRLNLKLEKEHGHILCRNKAVGTAD